VKKLDFKYIRAKNFLCFGPDGIELEIAKYGNIIHVTGENLDAKLDDGDGKKCSNASGKSSIPEILVYGLFGKTIKTPEKISHNNVIHNVINKGLEIEIILGDYRVLRTRKPNALRFWESEDGQWDDDAELTVGNMRATQKIIENRLGINYETFVNLVVFTDSNAGTFLESDGPQQRQIIDNLLNLSVYRGYAEATKKARKKIQDTLAKLIDEYERTGIELEASKKRVVKIEGEIKQWRENRVVEFNKLEQQIKEAKIKLANLDQGAAILKYNQSQDRIVIHNNRIPDLESQRKEFDAVLSQAQDRLDKFKINRRKLNLTVEKEEAKICECNESIEKSQAAIVKFETADGQECPYCLGVVIRDNYGRIVNKENQSIEEQSNLISVLKQDQPELLNKLKDYEDNISKLEKGIKCTEIKKTTIVSQLVVIRNEIHELSKVKEPEATTDERLLQQKINDLKKQALAKKRQIEGTSPMDEIMASAVAEIREKVKELSVKKKESQKIEKKLPYYEFWEKAFGDAGIRKFIIDGIVPALNARIAYWLQFLINNRKILTFDNQLTETIQRNPPDGNPFVYALLSNSERRLMNLAVLLSFAHVMSISCGFSPSLVFLDEVSTNIDPTGIEGVYNMICELSKEKKVFVTTHERDLQEKLDGCETLNLRMENHFSKIVP